MLEKIFTSKSRVKIMEFLFFHKEETHIREISNELKISPSAVKREIDNFKIIGIIKKDRNKIILNNKCNILQELKNIFIKTDFIVYPLKESMKKVKADFILIFGSFAKGFYSSESDVDLLFIGSVKQAEIFKILKPVEEKIGREINPVVWTVEELKKNKKKGFVRDIIKNKKIMIKGDENEFQRIIE